MDPPSKHDGYHIQCTALVRLVPCPGLGNRDSPIHGVVSECHQRKRMSRDRTGWTRPPRTCPALHKPGFSCVYVWRSEPDNGPVDMMDI
ncbi:hypothetical protein RRG08_049072 [Elysia crispata]|uniref:Uncharacterized protein n=1 Tax=Elysia crispata TaxID=231223 RepID=A0AAE1AAE0_9GAST|nr:hypothetical protein RRG08_049072 [Elysia crispata]